MSALHSSYTATNQNQAQNVSLPMNGFMMDASDMNIQPEGNNTFIQQNQQPMFLSNEAMADL